MRRLTILNISSSLRSKQTSVEFLKHFLHGFMSALETKRSELSLFLVVGRLFESVGRVSTISSKKNKLMNSFDELWRPVWCHRLLAQMVAKRK